MLLTKPEKNRIYEAIAGSGCNPADFTLSDTDDKTVVSHDFGSVFEFAVVDTVRIWDELVRGFESGLRKQPIAANRKYYSIKSVVIDGSERDDFAPDFTHLMIDLRDWAEEIKETSDTPDLWAELRQTRDLVGFLLAIDNGDRLDLDQVAGGQRLHSH